MQFYLLGYNAMKQQLHAGFLLSFIFGHDDGGLMFLKNNG
jgi:hypothetical protein